MWLVAVLIAGSFAFGGMRDYAPLSKKELATRVKMTSHRFDCKHPSLFRVGPAAFHSLGRDLRLSGVDNAGKPWGVLLASDNCVFWHADLDGDGVQDFIFGHWTSMGRTMEIVVILFDPQGRPVPWAMHGDFTTDENGILDFLDLNGDGRAELLWTSWEACSKSTCWTTELYESQAGYWHRVRGTFAGRTYPIGENNMGRLPDLGNTFGDAVKFQGYRPKIKEDCVGLRLPEAEGNADAIDDCHDWVLLEGGRACEAPTIVIIDAAEGRYISRSKALGYVQGSSLVRMAGDHGKQTGCAPIYMWVQER